MCISIQFTGKLSGLVTLTVFFSAAVTTLSGWIETSEKESQLKSGGN